MEGSAHLQHLLDSAREKIEFAFAEAASRGKEDYSVLVLDIRDPAARQMANTIAGSDVVARMADEAERRRTVPVLTVAQPSTTVLKLLEQVVVELAEPMRTTPPAGMFRVFALGNGEAFGSFLPKAMP